MLSAILLLLVPTAWLTSGDQPFQQRHSSTIEYVVLSAAMVLYLCYLWTFGILYVILDRLIVGRHLESCRRSQRCMHCRYSTQGLAPTNEKVLCPECGKTSPVAITANPT